MNTHTSSFIILLLFIPLLANGQTAFSTIGSTWKYEYQTLDCQDEIVLYRIENQVTKLGKDCFVMNAYRSFDGSEFEKESDSLILYSNDSKIFFEFLDSFYLLYDFDMNLGDTIDYHLLPMSYAFNRTFDDTSTTPIHKNLYVFKIDTINIHGKEVEVFYTNSAGIGPENAGMYRIAKGIGSIEESIVGHLIFFGSGCGGFLICHSSDTFQYGPSEECDIVLSTEGLSELLEINYYPNPVKDMLYVDNINKYANYEIIDFLGKTIARGTLNNGAIDLYSMNTGIYLVRLFEKSNNITAIKIMKE